MSNESYEISKKILNLENFNKEVPINFLWLQIFGNSFGNELIRKIIENKKLPQDDQIEFGIENVIPNIGNDQTSWRGNKFFAQNIVCWALTFKDNPVNLFLDFVDLISLKYFYDSELNELRNSGKENSKIEFYEYEIKKINDVFLRQYFKEKKLNASGENYSKKLEEFIQKKFETNMTLEEIKNEYKKIFKEFEKEIKKYNKNFNIINLREKLKEFDNNEN
jgi:hypothetical protein